MEGFTQCQVGLMCGREKEPTNSVCDAKDTLTAVCKFPINIMHKYHYHFTYPQIIKKKKIFEESD